ncbi:hypothetical protein CEXT_636371 [Caerostris extrusa]|uniref:Uncharacterized protein n=1 Tax=Caerostris extrusa TaxID=172846 RepID=A0AAV4WVT7_CAEEX|nr:hypothetical protein CEXT_636371 [Caerostris extrusa]
MKMMDVALGIISFPLESSDDDNLWENSYGRGSKVNCCLSWKLNRLLAAGDFRLLEIYSRLVVVPIS